MTFSPFPQFKINDRVLIAAHLDSIDAIHNGQVGRIIGFVHDWLVIVDIDGKELRFRPDELKSCSLHS